MSTPRVKVITDRQEMDTLLSNYNLERWETYDDILSREGWYYVPESPCTCPNGGEQGHNLTCGYYFKGRI